MLSITLSRRISAQPRCLSFCLATSGRRKSALPKRCCAGRFSPGHSGSTVPCAGVIAAKGVAGGRIRSVRLLGGNCSSQTVADKYGKQRMSLTSVSNSSRFLGSFIRKSLWRRRGAGRGNRTLVCSLGSCRSTIELHPHFAPDSHYCQETMSSGASPELGLRNWPS